MNNNFESILELNETNAKHAQWIVRILKPQLQDYTFMARGVSTSSQSFTCMLVSSNPKEYLHGSVSFDFKDKEGPSQAMIKFVENTVWIVSKPAFDIRAKAEYNGAPMKLTLSMRHPTVLRAVPPTETELYNLPCRHITPPATLADIKGTKNIKMTAKRSSA